MMMTLTKMGGRLGCLLLAALVVAPLAGCGDDDEASPFAGTYRVLQHTRANDGCDSAARPFEGDEFFRLEEDGDTLAYRRCEDEDNCDGPVNNTKSFTEQDSEGWRNLSIDSRDLRLACEVTLIERSARVEDDDLRVEQYTYKGEVERGDDEDCTDELILQKRSALECSSYEFILAIPVE